MSKKIDFAFMVGQKVRLVDADINGRIQSILQNADGIQFQVSYWDDRIRRVEWVFLYEIESLQPKTLIQGR